MNITPEFVQKVARVFERDVCVRGEVYMSVATFERIVAEQENNPNSVLSYVKGLLALRAATPALGVEGKWKYVGDMDHPYPMIYARTLGEEKYVVVFNPSKREVSGSIAPMGKKSEWVYGNNRKLAKCKNSKSGHTFEMKPFSVAIFQIK